VTIHVSTDKKLFVATEHCNYRTYETYMKHSNNQWQNQKGLDIYKQVP